MAPCSLSGVIQVYRKPPTSHIDLKRCYLHPYLNSNLHCSCFIKSVLTLKSEVAAWAQTHIQVVNNIFLKSIWDLEAFRDSDYAGQAVISQLFVRMLRGCSAVTLHKCFYGQEASLNSSSSRGSHLWANCSFKHVYSSSVFTFISWRGEVSRCSPLIWVSDAVVRASYSDVTTRVTVSHWSNIWLREF